ncbi:MAG: single-stranded-DNA-specific exonuclease RecJ, partial [Phycisphaerales bacterium]|nr:single-stranded-DNA-specific exonuclease RecJ [Phycisphaerales bacterium]
EVQGLTKTWVLPAESDDSLPVVERILQARGIAESDGVLAFLESKLSSLEPPETFAGMATAAKLLCQAFRDGKKVLIFGDYDADGITAASVLFHIFKSATGKQVPIHIPDRTNDGYGIKTSSIESFAKEGIELIVTVDCGITAIDAAALAKGVGIDLIITDHHKPLEDGTLPDCAAIVHPTLENESATPLAGVGVAYMLAWAFARAWSGSNEVTEELKNTLLAMLPITAIGTVADMVPLQGSNRILTRWGLLMMRSSTNEGVQALLSEQGLLEKNLRTSDISFGIAPMINAVGRLAHASTAVDVLTKLKQPLVTEAVSELSELNRKRQRIQKTIVEEALALITQEESLPNIVILKNDSWQRGIVGVAAGKCVETHYRPTILFAEDGGNYVGSARSIKGFSIFHALNACSELIEEFGGHDMAAGMTIQKSNFDAFKSAMVAFADAHLDNPIPSVEADVVLSIDDIKNMNIETFEQLAPFGIGNKTPIAVMKNVKVDDIKRMGKEGTHLNMRVGDSKGRVRCVWWGKGDVCDTLSRGATIHLIGKLSVNEFRNRKSIEIDLQDIALPSA